MVLGDVERLEVVEVALDLRPLGDREAEPSEDRHDLVVHAGERMHGPQRRPTAGQREVEPVARPLGARLALQRLGQPGVEQRLQLTLGLVGGGADERTLLRRQRAERAKELGQCALAAEVPDPHGLEVGRAARGLDRTAGLAGEGVDARVRHGPSAPAPWRSRRAC
jgi:hypothetical protein